MQRRDELEEFIYRFCYEQLNFAIRAFIFERPMSLKLSGCRLRYPDTARMLDMVYMYSPTVSIEDDILYFDAVVSCQIEVEQETVYGIETAETAQWFLASCRAVFSGDTCAVSVDNVAVYDAGLKGKVIGRKVSRNIVPIVRKDQYDDEATAFLMKYYPQALTQPIPVPIEEIIENNMGLAIIQGQCLTKDFSIFGEICFSSGSVNTWDIFKIKQNTIEVKRGTILIDAASFWERNVGCVNNTLAHEAYHWFRHRIYATIKQMLQNKKMIACRCPNDQQYPEKDGEWSDEQRMEYQATGIAPRILMPLKTFRMKVDELYTKYDYANTPLKVAVMECIGQELATFYNVSKQSALIRMIEAGYTEANLVYSYDKNRLSIISDAEAFLEYTTNEQFRLLLDSGAFVRADGHFVINDSIYVQQDDQSKLRLTSYAWEHLSECTLQFTFKRINTKNVQNLPFEIFHRANTNASREVPQYDATNSASAVKLSAEILEKRRAFEKDQSRYNRTRPHYTCWGLIYELIEEQKMNRVVFAQKTLLGEEVFSKAKNNHNSKPDLRTIVAIACGLDLGLDTTEELLRLAGHAFDDTLEHRVLRFCISNFRGQPIEERNEFLISYGLKPLGTKQRN